MAEAKRMKRMFKLMHGLYFVIELTNEALQTVSIVFTLIVVFCLMTNYKKKIHPTEEWTFLPL